MFTRDFRKPRYALAAAATACVLYAGFMFAGTALSGWAECDMGAYPFKEEDWLRYLLPTIFAPGDRDRILLTGPSTARENFRYERFQRAFPDRDVIQGGISLGTIEDVTASLEYIEKSYGAAALPKVIVMGIAPRFIANFPDDRPFRIGIDRYSPYYFTRQTESAIELVPRGMFDGMEARVRFLTAKQPKRIRTGLSTLVHYWLYGASPTTGGTPQAERNTIFDRILRTRPVSLVINAVGLARILDYDLATLLDWRISPYKYSLNPPLNLKVLIGWLNEPDSWWRRVYTWMPEKDGQLVRSRLTRFVNFVDARKIRLMVFNLPERDISRVKFREDNYRAYLALVTKAFGVERFVDLKDFLRPEEFYDTEHSMPAGSNRLTDEVIKYLQRPDYARREPAG